MARKNLLANLTDVELPAGNSTGSPPALRLGEPFPASGSTRGAIGAVSRSIEQIRSHSIMELAPDLIDASFIEDRLAGSDEDQARLTASMREHGQQVPILVRPHPTETGRYQIAYGRRRLRAAIELERPVRAVVKLLSDDQLVVAQGQENNERKDLSFIERAIFAAQLEARGFGRETIMAAMCVDKSGLSRLISSAVRIPRDIIQAIGPAPKTGRDRWSDLAVALDSPGAVEKVRGVIASPQFSNKASDERFSAVFRSATAEPGKTDKATIIKSDDGTRVALVRSDGDRLSLVVDKKSQAEFAAYLVECLPEIYARFCARAGA